MCSTTGTTLHGRKRAVEKGDNLIQTENELNAARVMLHAMCSALKMQWPTWKPAILLES